MGNSLKEPGISVISHRKWAPQKRPVTANIKAFFQNRDRMAHTHKKDNDA